MHLHVGFRVQGVSRMQVKSFQLWPLVGSFTVFRLLSESDCWIERDRSGE